MFCKYGKGGIRRPEDLFQPTAHLAKLRPCLADGKPATFHRWVEEETALLRIQAFMKPEDQQKIVRRFREEGVVDIAASVEKLRTCSALVEYADGSVGRVKPELIQFLDRKEG